MTETALAKASVPAEYTREKVELIKQTVAVGATDIELQLFLYTAQRTGLDPLAKQIHAVKRWNSQAGKEVMTIQTGIDGYRLIADRTGKLAGITDPIYDTEDKRPGKATVTVRKWVEGNICEFTASARWGEYCQLKKDGTPSSMWLKMPFLMLGKCAEALALRKAFPADLSGVYTFEEMSQADTEEPRSAPPQSAPPPPAKRTPVKAANMDVICAQCGGKNQHTADCPTQQKQEPNAEPAPDGPKMDKAKILFVDAFNPMTTKSKCATCNVVGGHADKCPAKARPTGKPYTMLDCTDRESRVVQVYVWDTALVQYMASWVGQWCKFDLSSKEKNGRSFTTLDNVIQVGSTQYEKGKPVDAEPEEMEEGNG